MVFDSERAIAFKAATDGSIVAENTTDSRPPPPVKTTTTINRVSLTVQIAVPVAIAGGTLLIGFGLIIYAVISGGHGIFFLTRTR
ncbi:unnamed protein product [Rotaria sordida]|uniref:Uncharacterized protein n=1 Tax=Rotaria sordida TaxID=392033 RepID=A0A814U3Y7_9BILA|nr:unnamed protein product [Rotaria sordida]CAF1043660.1 unnamed protein product [Rotaria sordida]CAF1168492.1 unnamed protein product [Rotaria sordida]CAF3590782.1 unnamed protein product [Rotaria sordida]CAF3604172.1 unnamed protein product [Rotaria sordida]